MKIDENVDFAPLFNENFCTIHVTDTIRKLLSTFLGHSCLKGKFIWLYICNPNRAEQSPTNDLSSYCGLLDAKLRASDKDLPVRPKPGFGIGN